MLLLQDLGLITMLLLSQVKADIKANVDIFEVQYDRVKPTISLIIPVAP